MTVPAATAGPRLHLRGRDIPVVLPSRRDPRLHLSAVLMTLQVMGQTVLEFKLSIAQILVTIAVAAAVEAGVTLWREGLLVWPASGILTGNSVAFILRANGTQHGDWWSLNGIEFFVLAAVLALLSKYLIRPGGNHIFNPSNVALVWVLLVIGPNHLFPQYLWWGPSEISVSVAMAVILAGAWWVLRPLRMLPMTAAYLVTHAVLVGVLALAGRSFIAIWADGPVAGLEYWLYVSFSPEVLVFLFFMMSDPRTAPRSPRGRILFGMITALVGVVLLSFQPTEFGIKLAILASLAISCALVPAIQRALERPEPAAWVEALRPTPDRLAALRNPAVVAAIIIAVGAAVNTGALAGNEQLIRIEQGLVGPDVAQ